MEEDFIDLNLYYDENNSENNIISNPLHLFFQEIELALKIAPYSMWGVKYSVDLNKYLFNQYISINSIKNELTNFIAVNCEHSKIFQYEINVELLNIENKDLIYIEFIIYNDNNDPVIQKFLLGQ